MKPLVLGLNSAHPDAAAVLADERGVIAAIAEERLNRHKHCAMFPRAAVHEVLRIAGVSLGDVTDIAIAKDPRANTMAKLAYLARRPPQEVRLARPAAAAGGSPAQVMARSLQVAESAISAKIHTVEHHLAHIASSFYYSPFEEATGLSIDGAGDFATLMVARCKGNSIEVLRRCHPPHSLGMFYTALSVFLGFNKFGEEYKVMGLAALGEDALAEVVRPLISWSGARGLQIAEECFNIFTRQDDSNAPQPEMALDQGEEYEYARLWTDELERRLGPPRQRNGPITKRDRDLACSMQRRFEQVYFDVIRSAVDLAGSRNLALAGGCAHNGLANGKAHGLGLYDDVFIPPAPGDDGTAMGAAAFVLYGQMGLPRPKPLTTGALGRDWSESELQAALGKMSVEAVKKDSAELVQSAAAALAGGKVVGWFQGREEFGARALGFRSILAHPGWPNMKELLNSRVKNREPFRPFAPAVLAERMSEVFEGELPAPFMGQIYAVREQWKAKLPAITHDDGTARVQSVDKGASPLFHQLISAFDNQTGVPVLLNTSFNENEPVVHTPEQALDCFKRTNMDCLAIGPFWCEKPQ